MTIEDPEWSDDDLEAHLLWLEDEDLKCSGCGQYRDESMAVGMDQAYDSEPVVCHACATRDRAIRAVHNGDEKFDDSGVYWPVYPRREGV